MCTPPRRVCVCVRISRSTADSAWLSKQRLENGCSRPRAFEAAERGKHTYPESGIKLIQESGHQAYPREWASNS